MVEEWAKPLHKMGKVMQSKYDPQKSQDVIKAVCAQLKAIQPLLKSDPARVARIFGYGPSIGMDESRDAIARGLANHFDTYVDSSECMVTHGREGGITHALQVLLHNKGKVVAFEEPSEQVQRQVEKRGGNLEICFDLGGFVAAVENAKAIIWNPNWTFLQKKWVIDILRDGPFKDIPILDISPGKEPEHELLRLAPDFKDRTVVIRDGVDFGAAEQMGIGMVMGPKDIVEAMANKQLIDVVSVNVVTQLALQALFKDAPAWSKAEAVESESKNFDLPEAVITTIREVVRKFREIPGEKKYNFSIGQPDTPLNPDVLASLIKELDHGSQLDETAFNEWLQTFESPDREHLVGSLQQNFPGVRFSENGVLGTNGAAGAMTRVLEAFKALGAERVITFTPAFGAYSLQPANAGLQYIAIDPGKGNKVNALDRTFRNGLIKEGDVLLLGEDNPLGRKSSQEELDAIVAFAKESGLWIVADEVYLDVVHNSEGAQRSIVTPENADRVVVINSGAKGNGLGAPGGRVGTVGIPDSHPLRETLMGVMTKSQQEDQGIRSIFTEMLSRFAAESRLNGTSAQWEQERNASFAKRKNQVVAGLKGMGLQPIAEPDSAFYVAVDVSSLIGRTTKDGKRINDAKDVRDFFLSKSVAMVEDAGFCPEGEQARRVNKDTTPAFVRMAFAISEEDIDAGLKRMKQAIDLAPNISLASSSGLQLGKPLAFVHA